MDTQRFVVREFLPEDDAACRAIERFASQARHQNAVAKAVFRAQSTHTRRFDAKARQFARSLVLVCEDTRPQPGQAHIVGVVMVGLKQCVVRGQPTLAGYMFDLRVHERAQRQRIGTALCELAETRCAELGVRLLYLSVNERNNRARALYQNLGFAHASRRTPAMGLLVWEQRVWPRNRPPGAAIAELCREEAATALARLGGVDCALDAAGMRALVAHEAYEKSWRATAADGSEATLHLWNASLLGGFRVERVLVPTRWLDSPVFDAAVAVALVALVAACTRVLEPWFPAPPAQAWFLMAALCALVAELVVPLTLFSRRVLLQSISEEDGGGPSPPKLRARLFAPSCSGDSGKVLLTALVRHASNHARSQGYALVFANLDERDDRRACFPWSWFATVFLQKRIGGDESLVAPFDPHAFHDPRDIS